MAVWPASAQNTAPATGKSPAWQWEAAYTAGLTGVIGGIDTRAGRYLDNLDVVLDGDMERQFGWTGSRVHFSLLANGGGEPNALAGTLQGIDNIEVAAPGLRLYEAWIEQDLAQGRASILAGLYDVNSDFYATDASGLLMAPPFGIGSELAATGPNGPAIFPSTALALRVRVGTLNTAYVQAAAVNARAGTFGDEDGVNTSFDDGLLYLAEAGWTGPLRLAAGGWHYDKGQPDIRDVTALGNPVSRDSRGAYVMAEGTLFEAAEGATVSGFARFGLSEGNTTDFRGGWQAGFRADSVFRGRPDSVVSLGFQQGLLSDKARANARDAGLDFAGAESCIELTYADTFGPVTLQPDLQRIFDPGAERKRDPIFVAGLRVILTLK